MLAWSASDPAAPVIDVALDNTELVGGIARFSWTLPEGAHVLNATLQCVDPDGGDRDLVSQPVAVNVAADGWAADFLFRLDAVDREHIGEVTASFCASARITDVVPELACASGG